MIETHFSLAYILALYERKKFVKHFFFVFIYFNLKETVSEEIKNISHNGHFKGDILPSRFGKS